MGTYYLKPDKRAVSVALNYNSVEDFDAAYPSFKVELLANTVEWEPFDNEVEFETQFKTLLANYKLEDHYDNLMYIVLSIYDDVWTTIQHAYDDYNSKKRARELAQLLILLEPSQPYKPNNITFKTVVEDAKINDPILIKWITKTLLEAIKNEDFPLGQFGDSVLRILPHSQTLNDSGEIDYDLLNEAANKRLINPKNTIKRGQFEICCTVYNYLQCATTLKALDGTTFSDAQLNFLFDLLELLKQVDRLRIGSEPKDYMSSLMRNFLQPITISITRQ